jgi:anti-sigma factor RsiW
MECKEFRQLLDLYVDGELSPEASFSALEHMETCVRCKQAQNQLLLLRQAVKRVVKQSEPPSDLVRKVNRITKSPWHRWPRFLGPPQTEAHVSFWRRKVSVPIPVFALLLFTVLIGGIWFISTQTSHRLTPTVVRKDDSVKSTDPGAFDLTQFDRGERAAIYKIRQSEVQNRQQ